MRKSYRKLLLMLCVAFATPVSNSKESPTLHWVKNDAPPFYIVDNDCQQGFGDQVQTVLEKRLKNYRHSTLFVPLSRLEHTWQEYNPLCFVTMIHEKPVNNEYLLSMPNAMYLPHGIITTNRYADTLPLQADGTLALEKLLEHRKVTMGHIAGRTYSEKLDSILRRQRKNIEVNSRAGATETQGILTMLSLGRFDFVIEYEFVLNHYVDSADYADQLRFIPISETRGTLSWAQWVVVTQKPDSWQSNISMKPCRNWCRVAPTDGRLPTGSFRWVMKSITGTALIRCWKTILGTR